MELYACQRRVGKRTFAIAKLGGHHAVCRAMTAAHAQLPCLSNKLVRHLIRAAIEQADVN
jgi:hypothetical protein